MTNKLLNWADIMYSQILEHSSNQAPLNDNNVMNHSLRCCVEAKISQESKDAKKIRIPWIEI